MRNILWLVLLVAVSMVSCTQSAHHQQVLSDAERIVLSNPDSALSMIANIDVSGLKEDSLKAQYHIIIASAHKADESSMASDSLIRLAYDYYKDKDRNKFVQSGELYALHRFWTGDGHGALELLDSLAGLPNIPDNIMIQLLRSRTNVGIYEFDINRNIEHIKRLLKLDKDTVAQADYKLLLCETYIYTGHCDSALILIDELIDYAKANHLNKDHFKYVYEKIAILEELGRYEESNSIVDYILEYSPYNSEVPYLHYWKALNYFNMENYAQSTRELAIADSCAERMIDTDAENKYYESFAGRLRDFLEYKSNGIIKLKQLATLNNSQKIRFNQMQSTRQEIEQNALKSENQALTLKAQNERKTAIIIILALTAIIIASGALWNIQKRRRRTIEAEERAETLQIMINEMKAPDKPSTLQDTLRRAMLQQLGIIKMVAETPTEQNREMLRKISSIESDTNGSLVNWKNVFEIIDNLYSGFYSQLHNKYGESLTGKEEQIIVLMMAGFSTKEISVISSQTTATIYVRKSSIRKKLGVPEKEDIVAFLRQDTSH